MTEQGAGASRTRGRDSQRQTADARPFDFKHIREADVIISALGIALHDLTEDQAAWSQATFGSDAKRDGVGALKHLAKEAAEAEEAARSLREFSNAQPGYSQAASELRTELADCLLLILDASRRSGVTPFDLLRAATEKMAVNKARTWPVPQDDTPVEHVRG